MSRNVFPLSLTATLLAGTAMADVPRVAADIAPLHSLVARVMQGVGTPDLIVPAGASPHEYSLRPSEAAALQDAELVFWMGAGLSPRMQDAIDTLAGDADVTALLEADETVLLDFRESALFEAHTHAHGDEAAGHDHDHGEHAGGEAHDHDHDHGGHADGEAHDHDHDHGEHAEGEAHDHDHDHGEHAEGEAHDHDHDHGGHAEGEAHDHDHVHGEHAEGEAHDHDHDHGEHAEGEAHDHDHGEHAESEAHDHGHAHGDHDPHAWLSPDNAAAWLDLIAGELSAADPDNAGAYFANAAEARAELETLMAEVDATLDPVRGGNFIVFHDAYQYFETAFDFPASGAISLSDARDPSPARIAEIQDRVADQGIDCVLAEPQFNPGIVATVMEGTEASTGVIDPLGSDLDPGPGLYPQLLRNMATSLAGCL